MVVVECLWGAGYKQLRPHQPCCRSLLLCLSLLWGLLLFHWGGGSVLVSASLPLSVGRRKEEGNHFWCPPMPMFPLSP